MKILAIETSCDETAVAVVSAKKVLSNCVYSQIKHHKKYGGVVPEVASRLHAESIHLMIKEALGKAGCSFNELEAIAVTQGPGLEGALLIGITVAKTLGKVLSIPVIPVNHLHGHIYSAFLGDSLPAFPFICLIVSGGHTHLYHVTGPFESICIGKTMDDAVGEAFDKVSRYLGLGYPGGPLIEKAAKEGDKTAYHFPRAVKHQEFAFSFSGLKTAVIQKINSQTERSEAFVSDIAASFQYAACDILSYKALLACETYQSNTLVVCGGVSANQFLREIIQEDGQKKSIKDIFPPFAYCTDNAAMIGIAAAYKLENPSYSPPLRFEVKASLPL